MNKFTFENDYVKIFKLKNKVTVNRFIKDWIDISKVVRCTGFKILNINLDYVETFKLKNNHLINQFIEDFCDRDGIDEAVKIANRYTFEKEVGIDIFREEHNRNILEMEEKRLKREFDRKHRLN